MTSERDMEIESEVEESEAGSDGEMAAAMETVDAVEARRRAAKRRRAYFANRPSGVSVVGGPSGRAPAPVTVSAPVPLSTTARRAQIVADNAAQMALLDAEEAAEAACRGAAGQELPDTRAEAASRGLRGSIGLLPDSQQSSSFGTVALLSYV